MRLWSLHPQYLDAKGIVALWREALLAQHVLHGKTRGYRHHPQLDRFKSSKNPKQAIGLYLASVWEESARRGYHFDKSKILKKTGRLKIRVTRGQMDYELSWLRQKLKTRDPARYKQIRSISKIKAHPLFTVTPGPVESWEKV